MDTRRRGTITILRVCGFPLYRMDTNQLFFDNRSYPLSFLNDSKTVVDDNRWHSCAVVLDGQGTNLVYVDGVLSAQDSSISTLTGVVASPYVGYYDSTQNYLNNQFWRIGASQWSSQIWNVFNGLIDDVRIYNRALTSSEVGQLYPTNQRHKSR